MPFLDWVNKNQAQQASREVAYHLLKQEAVYGDSAENLLIQGDNLLALKALIPFYAGRVKCIFIDPPYNTQSAFAHYDDKLEHSQWLSMMYPRLVLLRDLLAEDGSIWVTIDDNEAHYLKALMDEVFGRKNFVTNVIWEKADSPRMDAKYFSSRHDHVLVYAKKVENLIVKRIGDEGIPVHYNKVDEDGRIYYLKPLRAMGADGHREKRPSMYFSITAPDGQEVFPKNPDGSDSRWRWGLERVEQDQSKLEWIKSKSTWSLYFRIYHEDSIGKPPETLWVQSDVGSNRTSKKEIKDLFQSDVFDTPKPEKLIQRILC